MVKLDQIVAVVDDDESVRRAIKRLLRSVGIEAETFPSGEAFLDRLSSAPSCRPACAIVDFEMPGISGLELLRRLAPAGVPVILMTGNDAPVVCEEALAIGAAGCLRKPINGDALMRGVEEALEQRQLP